MAGKLHRQTEKLRADIKATAPATDTDTAEIPRPAEFRANLLIDADGRTVPFRPDPWQEEDFAALDAAWLAVAGFEVDGSPICRAWEERPRGHSKTADLAVMVAWALCYSRRPIKGIAAAADKDQARLLRDAVETLVRLNPALRVLDVQTNCVVNRETGSQLDILSSDVATSYGQLPDFILCDEVAHWPDNRGESLWHSLFSAAAKRAHCLFIVITNAGFTESWVWTVREAIRTDPSWHFSRLDGPRASWITQARLDEQQRILPPLVYDRLWLNVWSSGSGDAIQGTDLDAAVTLAGPMPGPEQGYAFFAGIDLSVSRDLSALVMIGRHYSGRIRLARVQAWTPPKGGKIDLGAVLHACLELHRAFGCRFYADPYQAELLCQQLAAYGVFVQTIPFVGQTLVEMASGLIEIFNSRKIDLYRDAELLADLRRLRLKESPAGWRLDAPRTSAGHCDRATALSLAVLGARRSPLQDTAPTDMPFLAIPGWRGGQNAGGHQPIWLGGNRYHHW